MECRIYKGRKTGVWDYTEYQAVAYGEVIICKRYFCSCCRHEPNDHQNVTVYNMHALKYCFNCGAKMSLKGNNDDSTNSKK